MSKKSSVPSASGKKSLSYIPTQGSSIRKFFAFAGPGLLIAVGYMDPGNWATDIEGGAKYGYLLLSVVLLSNIFAIILQHLSLKLGVASELDLARACRKHFNPGVNYFLWALAEIAIAATDLAEVIGSAIALNLLFNIPLLFGILITASDVLLLLFFQKHKNRFIEIFIGILILSITACFCYEVIASHPEINQILSGLVPNPVIIRNNELLYLAIGILGATVMPHNLYLHSNIAQEKNYEKTYEGKKQAIKFLAIDNVFSLSIAFVINAAILITSAASFHFNGHEYVSHIRDAYKLLSPILGASIASTVFGIALLASGQNSTITGTLAGQIVMEGFLQIKIKPWIRRLATRMVAIIPAVIVTYLKGTDGITELLILSQVILSLQLSFAVFPLLYFTSKKSYMGPFANNKLLLLISWATGALIALLNITLIYLFLK